ncbi:hypothetical protein T265_11182 [Opisthorchis viverrini]|uniref:Protein kinase domain-containing protein n=1 Tax=Opisthorchis viverrini TaxID=6198 RepID=A0A074YZM1_OPIVI|nr:hypothetical protein T265_11182 [Opisthorchis viverrini]KER20211.1 hypothetical protein T265_11182 [Opisthorchis viverrini]
MRRIVRRQVKVSVQGDREVWWTQSAKEVEEVQKVGNELGLFQLIRATSPREPPVSETIKGWNRVNVSNEDERIIIIIDSMTSVFNIDASLRIACLNLTFPLDVCCVSEARIQDPTSVVLLKPLRTSPGVPHFNLRVSGNCDAITRGIYGVVVALIPKAEIALLDWIPVNGRLCAVRLSSSIKINAGRFDVCLSYQHTPQKIAVLRLRRPTVISASMYCEELSNSVQSIDLHDSCGLRKRNTDTLTAHEDSEETTIAKVGPPILILLIIQREGKPILPPGYQLSHCLAEGGMGRVFLVVNPETKDCLAAKVVSVYGRMLSMKNAEENVAKIRADLRQEAELQRRLKHHHVATVYGIRNTPSFTFMFMELLPGGELFDRIPIGVGLHVQQMFIYYSQILDALHYLHTDQLIAHLDVKPENIMLTRKDRAKLIDFGWAVDLSKNPVLKGPVGTTSYAAPEVFGRWSVCFRFASFHCLRMCRRTFFDYLSPPWVVGTVRGREDVFDQVNKRMTDEVESSILPCHRHWTGLLTNRVLYACALAIVPTKLTQFFDPYSGPPVDIFSLGVTLLTAVTGQRCWSRANPDVDPIYKQWVDRRDLHAGPIFSRLPPDLANFLTRVLAHRPSERLTVDGVRSHPWFRRGLLRRLTPVAPPPRPVSTNRDTHRDSLESSISSRDSLQPDAPVPSSQPVYTCLTQADPTANDLRLSQPADMTSMLMASQSADPDDMRLGFSCLMKRMTRFFSALSSVEHTMEVMRAVIIQRRQLRPISKGPGNLMVQIRNQDHPGTAFRILLYPLAGSILADCRRISGDGLLFHQTYAALYADLVAMGAVNESHPYLRMILPDQVTADASGEPPVSPDPTHPGDQKSAPMEC